MIKSIGNLQKQTGAVLIVALIMVLLITIVGLSAIRGSGLQEQMAGNMRDRNLAFQSAEAALREGETYLSGVDGRVFDVSAGGFYEHDNIKISATGRAFWVDFDWGVDAAEYPNDIDKVSEKPRFVVERVATLEPGQSGGAIDWSSLLNTEPEIIYRVTSRATGGTTDTAVMLQSTFK